MDLIADVPLEPINPATPEGLRLFVEALTGQPPFVPDKKAEARLLEYARRVANEGIGVRELNAILILLGQNRVSRAFVECFFGATQGLGSEHLRAGLGQFRMWAMLTCGNFRHPYQIWRKLESVESIRKHWGHLREPREALKQQTETDGRSVAIEGIPANQTFATGILAAGEVLREFRVAVRLAAAAGVSVDPSAAQQACLDAGLIREGETIRPADLSEDQLAAAAALFPASRLSAIAEELTAGLVELARARATALRNTIDYLLAHKVDVYVATSMRERWEFEETAGNLKSLFESDRYPFLRKLDYFDPTQSFTWGPVDKGIIEGLMLHRVKVTFYMAQESDTLGKDSELAATLAQGKPVIAYVPRILESREQGASGVLSAEEVREVEDWVQKFRPRPITFFRKRLLLLEAADVLKDPVFAELCIANGLGSPTTLLEAFEEQYREFQPLFSLVPDQQDRFRAANEAWFERFLKLFVFAEAVNFEKRARTLRLNHPLAMQLTLKTGVANGVLVVRRLPDAAELLERLLLNDVRFEIHEERKVEDVATVLEEEISQSRYRTVTHDAVLTASFWNFFKPSPEV